MELYREVIMKLGTDPEFVFLGPEGLVPANDYFPRQVNGGHNNPEIGGDGHAATAELRPKAAESPVDVVANIKGILQRSHNKLPDNVAWRAGSYCEGKTLGGHIHFGDIQLVDSHITVLDGIVGQVTSLLEDAQEARQRRSTKYGKLADIRVKPWGFEYRTLASWIVSPEIATGVLALAKACILEELEEGPMSLSKLKGQRLTTVIDINRNAFINLDKSHFLDKLNTLWGIIRRYHYFRTEEGGPLWCNVALLAHIARRYPSWHTDRDILHRWKVRTKTPDSYTKKFNVRRERIPPQGRIPAAEAIEILRG